MKWRSLMGGISGSHSGGPEMGITKGHQAGYLGLWVNWGASASAEIFRAKVTAVSPELGSGPIEFSFTFAPAFQKPFWRSLEMTLEFKEFLVGQRRVEDGQVTFEVWGDGDLTISRQFKLDTVLHLYRGKGGGGPEACTVIPGFALPDGPEIAAMPRSQLKAYSEKIKGELEEKARKAEEERLAREAAKAAAEKAAAEKAIAAEKAKAAKAAAPKKEGSVDASGPTLKPARCGIFYGTSTGNTEEVANMIKAELGDKVEHVKNVTQISPVDLTVCEILILGVPTWHIGEMQDDWATVLPELDRLNFAGKKVAVFGLGDGKGYPDTYVDAMEELLVKFEKTGAKLHGLWPTEGYDFQKSKAIRDGKFLGLVIDVENQDDKSEGRVKKWVQQLRKELDL